LQTNISDISSSHTETITTNEHEKNKKKRSVHNNLDNCNLSAVFFFFLKGIGAVKLKMAKVLLLIFNIKIKNVHWLVEVSNMNTSIYIHSAYSTHE